MKKSSLLFLAINRIKKNKMNIIYVILSILIFLVMTVGFSFYKSLVSFWKDTTEKAYDFNLVSIYSGTADIPAIIDDLSKNENVLDTFYYNEFSSVGVFEEFKNKNINGEVRLVGTIPNTKKIKYGEDLSVNKNGIICPDNFLPDSLIYYGNYDINNIINLKSYLNKKISFKFIGQYNTSLELVGIFDSRYDYSSPNVCYVNHSTLKMLNNKYQSNLGEDTKQAFILFKDIKKASEILKKYEGIEYMPVKIIKKDLGNKILTITSIISGIILFIFFVFSYFLNNRKIIKESKNIGIFKVCGYEDKEIKKIFYTENILLFFIAIIISIIISSYVIYNIPLWFFSKNPYLSLMNVRIDYQIILITILINIFIIIISTNLGLKKIENIDINEVIYD